MSWNWDWFTYILQNPFKSKAPFGGNNNINKKLAKQIEFWKVDWEINLVMWWYAILTFMSNVACHQHYKKVDTQLS